MEEVEFDYGGDDKPAREKQEESLEFKEYGRLDPSTAECLAVGWLLGDYKDPGVGGVKHAEYLLGSSVRPDGDWFENDKLANLYKEFVAYYKKRRERITVDAAMEMFCDEMPADEALAWQDIVEKCHGAVLSRYQVTVEAVVRRMTDWHDKKLIAKAIKEYRDKRDKDHAESTAKLILDVTKLKKIDHAVIRDSEWLQEYDQDMALMLDMKNHPEKYVGWMCGISAIDDVMKGFMAGQLTTFIGAPGGYKSTIMLNIAYTLWKLGLNVLFASLETEQKIMRRKLWCRATRRISWGRLRAGYFCNQTDWAERDALKAALQAGGMTPEQAKAADDRIKRLDLCLGTVTRGYEDDVLLEKLKAESASVKNELRIVNLGMSNKLKIGQLRTYLDDNEATFKPQIVIVDYLALVEPDQADKTERSDQNVGFCTKALRSMGEQKGFAVITAAQYNRAALKRIREAGTDSIDKAELGMDDIAESHQIGADSDYVFMLWKSKGNDKLAILNTKNRHGEMGSIKYVQVDGDTCTVADDIQDSADKAEEVDLGDINPAWKAMNKDKGGSSMDMFGMPPAPLTDLGSDIPSGSGISPVPSDGSEGF